MWKPTALILILLAQNLKLVPEAQSPSTQQPLVRITVNLVQVDAIVTDSKGHQVTDLTSEDFSVLQDGTPQEITNLSYVRTQPLLRDAAIRVVPRQKGDPPAPPVRTRRENVLRTVAIVVDDLGMSTETVPFVKRGLQKYISESVQPGDLVAIVRTSSGMGALQQYTSDRRLLESAISEIRWLSRGFAGTSPIAPIGDPLEKAFMTMGAQTAVSASDLASQQSQIADRLAMLRQEMYAVGTLGSLVSVIRGMRDMPGRKALVLLAEGMRIHMNGEELNRTNSFLNNLADMANRMGVAIYGVDTRGLQTLQVTASDDAAYLPPFMRDGRLSSRRQSFYDSQAGMRSLAEVTGGFLVSDSSDIGAGVRTAMEDQSGYYLIGYRPPPDTFQKTKDSPGYHRISVRMKRPGLKVRARQGFFGVAESETSQPPQGRENQLLDALAAPFNSGAIRLRITSMFSNSESLGTVVRSFLHVDANDLTFTKSPQGGLKAIVDILAVTYGEGGAMVDQAGQTFSIEIEDDQYEDALAQGFLYTLDVPVRKPGVYQLRVAVRDASSEHTGSGHDFVEVPDLTKGALAISGIVLKSAAPPRDNDPANGRSSHAVRVFNQGDPLTYAFQIYNARIERKSQRPQVETIVRLFRDSQMVWSDTPKEVDAKEQADVRRLVVGGILQTGTALQPGEYALQVIARDRLAKQAENLASQWIDFDIR